MTDILPFLKSLLSAPGLSGNEDPAADLIAARWRPLVDQLSRGRLGSLHALRRGSAKDPRPSVMVATHMDAIGLMVTGIEAGFLARYSGRWRGPACAARCSGHRLSHTHA